MDSVPAPAFGPFLRRLRLEAGLSQEELAESASLSVRGVSDLERGRRTSPRPETVRLLAEALKLSPAEHTALIAAAHPELTARTLVAHPPGPVSPAAGGRTSLLLSPPTRLVGRGTDVERLCGLLTRDEVRLITLTGPGGVGKTRLALAAAAELEASDRFTDGFFLVELAPVREPALVASAIAAALGIKESGSQPLADSLGETLRDRRLLLVLDNFEHVLPAALLVAGLLASCPNVVILATSRERLHLRGERELTVEPLALPDPATSMPIERIASVGAVQLFIERAEDADFTFALTAGNAPAIAELCRRLDGLPLAIELAAARIRLLPPEAMLTRLTTRLPLLTGGARDLPLRQQTLRNTIAWSYELLTPDEQARFRRLSVFAGGASLAAIKAVAGGDEPDADVLAGLERLVDLSLLRQPEPAGEPRFGMLETIREYGLEQLDASGEATEAHQRHAAFFLAFARTAEPALTGHGQRQWLERLETEHDNLGTALAWTLERDPGAALRLAANLWRFWYTRGHLGEGRGWLDRVLTTASPAPARERAMALQGASTLAWVQGDHPGARASAAGALACSRAIGDWTGVAHALNALGDAELMTDGEGFGRAGQLYGEALGLFQDAGDQRGTAGVLTNLGNLVWGRGELDRAAELHDEALVLYRKVGDERGIAWSLSNLGVLNLLRGEPARAFAPLREALGLYVALGDRDGIAESLEGLGGVGSTPDAARLLGAAEALRQILGRSMSPAERATNALIAGPIRAAIGEDAFAAAWAAGRALTIEDAVATALAMTKDGIQDRGEPGTGPGDSGGNQRSGIDVPGKRCSQRHNNQ
ncbi:MAG: tetratricopeptide repeat protein [Chloroflexota bacterium]|nr:tetratricopeptide repeat protein [Chloroflexota bacterium]